MIISLIGIGSASATNRVLASRLESILPETSVQCLDAPGRSRTVLDQLTAKLLDTSPDLAAICCTVLNVGLVTSLCRRLNQVMPDLAVVLGGPEAASGLEKLQGLDSVTHVVDWGDDVAGRLVQVASGLGARLAARAPSANSADPYRGQMGDLARVSRTVGSMVVEPTWGGDYRTWMHHHLRPASRGQDPRVAAARLAPLLRAGISARLADPVLASDGESLGQLLALLEGKGARLSLDLPDTVLDDALVRGLCRCGVRQVSLDLHGLVSGALDPEALALCIERLTEGGVVARGELTYALPDMDWAGFGRAVDCCVESGVDHLLLGRLVAPPGSAPRAAGVVFARSPPNEVLATDRAAAAEVLSMVGLAVLIQHLSGAFVGTGLLRALAREAGSIFEIVEGFGDELAIQGDDLITRDLPARVTPRFCTYLEGLGFDFRPAGGGLRLQRASSLALRWTGDSRRLLDENTGKSAQVGWGAVGLLDRFGQGRPVDEVCEGLVSGVPAHRQGKLRRDLHRTVDKLVAIGALEPACEATTSRAGERSVVSLEEFDYHYRMLTDRARVQAYEDAIRAVVQPGDHVVEIGTGTGILAVLAARAGARVTAIERYSILDMARSVARRSGVEHLIDFVRGDAEEVVLDRPGDVLLSEIVGNRIFNEGLLEATLDARARLLRPEPRLIPRRIEVQAQLGYSNRFEHVAREFHSIGERHAVDLGPLNSWFDGYLSAGKVVWEQGPHDEGGFEGLSPVVPVVDLDLGAISEANLCAAAEIPPHSEGTVNAVVLSFRLTLLPGIDLSSHEQRTDLHWCRPVYMLGAARTCRPGQPVRVELRYEAHGEIGVSVP